MRISELLNKKGLVALFRDMDWTEGHWDDVISDRVYIVVILERDVITDLDYRNVVNRVYVGGRLVYALVLVGDTIYSYGCDVYLKTDGSIYVSNPRKAGPRAVPIEDALRMRPGPPSQRIRGRRALRGRGFFIQHGVRMTEERR